MNNVSSSNSQKALVPELRFPEFRDDWKSIKFANLFEFLSNNTLSRADLSDSGTVKNIHYGDVLIKFGDVFSAKDNTIPFVKDKTQLSKNTDYLKNGDIIIADTAEDDTVGKATEIQDITNESVVSGLHTIPCRAKEDFAGRFLGYYLNSSAYHSQLYPLMQGIKVTSISKGNISKTELKFPSINEQRKIACMLSLIDKKIEAQKQMINSLKLYKRGLIFSLFKENNVFNSPVERLPLSTLLTEYKNKNSAGLRVCSVAVNKGVVDQVEHLGRSFSANDTSKYNQVKQGDIIYTKSPTGDFPFGIVKQNKLNEVVAVSPLYGVYTPKNYEVGNLLHHYFEQHQNANNYIKPLAQKGAKNTINITNQNFLAGNVLFPKNSNDIVKMSQAFETIQKQIECNELLHNQLILTKSYFLQKMFI